ncbi:MAG: LytR C-terminal domain-containing protein [Patescibacteria group bacterium]|jgi:hypothetical protein
MASLDGISGTPRRAPAPRPAPAGAPSQSRRAPRRRGGSFIGFLLVLALGTFGVIALGGLPGDEQPETIARDSVGVPTEDTTLPSLPEPSTNDPSELVVLDDQRSGSAPQPEPNKAAPTPTEKPAQSATVRILNGGAPQGAAGTLKTALEQEGYTVLTVGNARSAYDRTTIYYAPGHREVAVELVKALGETSIIQEESTIAAPAKLLVVLGNNWK